MFSWTTEMHGILTFTTVKDFVAIFVCAINRYEIMFYYENIPVIDDGSVCTVMILETF